MSSAAGVSMNPEVVAEFANWPSGIAVSRSNRIFVTLPRIDPERPPATLVEILDGKPSPFPDALVNDLAGSDSQHRFVSVHGITIGPGNRLLALDTGAHDFSECDPAAAKLWVIDLDRDAIVHGIGFARDVCLPSSYLNDVVIDYSRGAAGTAFISDSGVNGPNGIITVDLASGLTLRHLSGHSSVRVSVPDGFRIATELGTTAAPPTVDGIAVSPDGRTLWWTPLGSYDFFSIETDILCDPTLDEELKGSHVVSHGPRDFASDGLDSDREGRVYLTDITNGIIQRFIPAEQRFEKLFGGVRRFRWPDAVRVAPDRRLYVTDSQLNRLPGMNGGQDRREPPYRLYRAANDADPAQF
jgi:sugar lactone lactonase YvrE